MHMLLARSFNVSATAEATRDQWTYPQDVFSILLILGGDIVARAIAQLAGTWITPVAFSFGE
jgi:hypothetical protein